MTSSVTTEEGPIKSRYPINYNSSKRSRLKLLIPCLVFVGLTSASYATLNVTIDVNSTAALFIRASDNSALADGDIIRVGYFSNPALLATDHSFEDLNAMFTPFDENVSINSGMATETGYDGHTLDINDELGPSTFTGAFEDVSDTYLPFGSQLYVWIFNSPTLSTATQWGIFDDTSWTFPSTSGTATLDFLSTGVTAIQGNAVVVNNSTEYFNWQTIRFRYQSHHRLDLLVS